jgi:hypothetical protein
MKYDSQCCNATPSNNIITSKPSTPGQYPKDRRYLIESNEGHLIGDCSKCGKISRFNQRPDTPYRDSNEIILERLRKIDKKLSRLEHLIK